MRIIDNNKDFYDYCQNMYPDDLNTFDRRDSYNLSKEEFAHNFDVELNFGRYRLSHKKQADFQRIVLLQICNTFWMFLLTITKYDTYGRCEDYVLSLLDKWKDYSSNVKREKIRLSTVNFYYKTIGFSETLDDPKIIERMKSAIMIKDFNKEQIFNKFVITKDGQSRMDGEARTIPILKNIGIPALVDPLDIYLALDEYFSKEKTENERDASTDITDKEKVINHGFDVKTSFRGKKWTSMKFLKN